MDIPTEILDAESGTEIRKIIKVDRLHCVRKF